jgi:hypothetical protein
MRRSEQGQAPDAVQRRPWRDGIVSFMVILCLAEVESDRAVLRACGCSRGLQQ